MEPECQCISTNNHYVKLGVLTAGQATPSRNWEKWPGERHEIRLGYSIKFGFAQPNCGALT